MWWKLAGLIVLAAALVFAIVPIRTRAIFHDPSNEPPPALTSLGDMLGHIYLTPSTVLLILCIVAVAGYAAFKVLRGHW